MSRYGNQHCTEGIPRQPNLGETLIMPGDVDWDYFHSKAAHEWRQTFTGAPELPATLSVPAIAYAEYFDGVKPTNLDEIQDEIDGLG